MYTYIYYSYKQLVDDYWGVFAPSERRRTDGKLAQGMARGFWPRATDQRAAGTRSGIAIRRSAADSGGDDLAAMAAQFSPRSSPGRVRRRFWRLAGRGTRPGRRDRGIHRLNLF